MNPSTREETFMRGISNVLQGNSSGVSIAPSSRTEYFLNEILEAASGGGGGGGSDVFTVKFTTSDFETYTADKTYSEVSSALSSGKDVRAVIIFNRMRYEATCINSESTSYVNFKFTTSILTSEESLGWSILDLTMNSSGITVEEHFYDISLA